jgi:cell division septation protein DedD
MEPALKQRLVGAAVLIALAVIFLPMLIQGPAPESGVADVPLDAPRAPQGEFETRDLPLVAPEAAPADGALGMDAAPAPANPDAADLASAAPAAPPPAATVATAPLASTPITSVPISSAPLKDAAATTTQALPAESTAPAEMFPAPTAGGNYAVNFGSFSTTAAADKLIASLRNSQLPGYREAATVDGKTVQRVRIGPYATRAQAESARLKAVHVRDDVAAKVVALNAEPLPPAAKPPAPATKPSTTTAAATTPAKPAPTTPAAAGTGFAVQLAAFSKAADATALRDRLRAAGFSAFTEAVNTDKGTLTRVRVGPVLNRAEADQLKAQVKSKIGLDGVVRPHP